MTPTEASLLGRSSPRPSSVSCRSVAWLALVCGLTLLASSGAQATEGLEICGVGNVTTSDTTRVTASCTVTGDLEVVGSGLVWIDYSNSPDSVFRMEGAVTLADDATFVIDGGKIAFQQDYNRHREIQASGDSTLGIINSELEVNQGANFKYMMAEFYDNAFMAVVGSELDGTNSWLLGSFYDSSALTMIESQGLPTEVYIKDSSTVQLAGPTTTSGVWLDLYDGLWGVVDLPLQVDAGGAHIPYSWAVGRDQESLSGASWQLTVANAKVGIGLESHDGSSVQIHGKGIPATGEATIGYHVDGGTRTLSDLGVGLQSRVLDGGRLTLWNVHLGRVAWQVYANHQADLTITNSIINEVGATNGARISVSNSYLQLASLAAFGVNSRVDVQDSQVFSSVIEVLSGEVSIQSSAINGSAMTLHDASASISVDGGGLLTNATSCDAHNPVDEFGIPGCNPWIAAGAGVTVTGPGSFSCTDALGCDDVVRFEGVTP